MKLTDIRFDFKIWDTYCNFIHFTKMRMSLSCLIKIAIETSLHDIATSAKEKKLSQASDQFCDIEKNVY